MLDNKADVDHRNSILRPVACMHIIPFCFLHRYHHTTPRHDYTEVGGLTQALDKLAPLDHTHEIMNVTVGRAIMMAPVGERASPLLGAPTPSRRG